jgi:TonB family protein
MLLTTKTTVIPMTWTATLDVLADLGATTAHAFWLPVLVWTAVALPVWGLLARTSLHPLAHYRLRQVLLAALPVGLVATALVDASGWLAALGGALWPASSGSVQGGATVVIPDATAVPASSVAPSIWSWTQLVGAATVVAVGGALVGLGRLTRDLVAFCRLRRSVETTPASDLQEQVDALCDRLRIRRTIRVEVTERDVVPMTLTGWPVTLLLPERLTDQPEALRMTLLHECIHVRRRDDLAHVAERLVAAAFAALPVVGWLQQSIMHVREQACDAAVLDDHATRPSSYAELLVAFADRAAPSQMATLPLSESPSSLKERLHAMNRHVPVPSARWISGLAVALLAATTLGIVACSDSLTPPTHNNEAKTQPPKPLQELSVGDDPLYVVDGEERDSVDDLKSDAIASVEVLKGEAATDKYGERGTNGVVIITTTQDATGAASDTEPTGDEVFVVVEEQPDCGGVRALQQHIQYPEMAAQAGIEGRVFVQFIVDETGAITQPTVTKGVHEQLDEAALSAVKKLECEPGRTQGDAVKVKMALPVTFRLDGVASETTPADPGGAPQPRELTPSQTVDTPPRIQGGMKALSDAGTYPELAKKAGIEGRVLVQFTVGEDGSVSDAQVTSGVHDMLNQAALEAVKQLSFEPGRKNGQPVSVQVNLPVTFRTDQGVNVGQLPPRESSEARPSSGADAPQSAQLTIQFTSDGTLLVNGTPTPLDGVQQAVEQWRDRMVHRNEDVTLSVRVDGDAPRDTRKRVLKNVQSAFPGSGPHPPINSYLGNS